MPTKERLEQLFRDEAFGTLLQESLRMLNRLEHVVPELERALATFEDFAVTMKLLGREVPAQAAEIAAASVRATLAEDRVVAKLGEVQS